MSLAKLLFGPSLSQSFPIQVQHFEHGQWPGSSFDIVLPGILVYFLVVYGGHVLMRSRKPLRLHNITQTNNGLMVLSNLVLAVLFLEDAVPKIMRHGFFYGACSPDALTHVSTRATVAACFIFSHIHRHYNSILF